MNSNGFITKLGTKLLFLFSRFMPDRVYVKLLYRNQMNRRLNLKNPVTFNEKLQWLKLYDRRSYYTKMVDKITAKGYVASIIGSEYIIPTLGIWESFDNIDFSNLPNEFVLKTNNGGGGFGVFVCKDKSSLDKEKAKRRLEKSLNDPIWLHYREWPYKNIKPMIFAERYLFDNDDGNRGGLTDYKFTCFNGQVDNVMVCVDRNEGDTKFYFYDKEWHLLPLNIRGKNTPSNFQLPKPPCLDEMFEIASKLSKGIPFLRVDLYCINGKVYFGETTFYPASGLDSNLLPETELLFGGKIELPKI